MTTGWVCIDSGARQPSSGTCAACGREPTLELADERTREFMRDVDLRQSQRREAKFRFIGVAVGMGVIFALWTQGWYWSARGRFYPGLPALFDQWLFMAVIGFGVSKLLEKRYDKKRFPYLGDDLSIAD